MKINCDMGESYGPWKMGRDDEVMPFIDMANIACGFHASEPLTMYNTVQLAVSSGVEVGAHPGYPDLLGFGRRDYHCSREELIAGLLYQMGALDAICKSFGKSISYVKPHGALYNKMMVSDDTMSAVMTAVSSFREGLPLMVMSTQQNDALLAKADKYDLPLLFEAFVDRAYTEEGLLANRRHKGAVHTSFSRIELQVQEILLEGHVTTIDGKRIPLKADTLCIHGDGEHAVEIARFVRELMDGD
jgi:UPF0271 protein